MRYFFLFFFLLVEGIALAQLPVTVSAEAALLMNADTGAILYAKKPHAKLFPASITKIATAAYALKLKGDDLTEMMEATQECVGSVTEEAKQRSNYTLPSHWLVTDSSHIGIKRGEVLSLKDLLYGMMVASGDDASNVIAEKLGQGSIASFMEGVNAYIKDLGCKDTFFNNPHGLHHPKHVTTAYDMALMTKEALKNAKFREIVATTRYTRPKTNKQESTILVQTNKLLRKGDYYYPRAIGVKTGRHSKAGHTLVAAAQEGDRTLIAVILNAKERKDIFKDAIALFNAAFQQPKINKTVIQAGAQKHSIALEGADKPIKTMTMDEGLISYYRGEEPKLKAYLRWDQLSLPIEKGQKVGEIHLATEDQKVMKILPLYAEDAVGEKLSFKIKNFFKGNSYPILGVIILALLGYAIYRKSR